MFQNIADLFKTTNELWVTFVGLENELSESQKCAAIL